MTFTNQAWAMGTARGMPTIMGMDMGMAMEVRKKVDMVIMKNDLNQYLF